ncbi:hypothetical protein GCM10011414_24930 [Croceivirga lutea]|uniref:vWA domain-containing protein n=1 Tax=Croceivirga lutea TaxID=1775167 RepID=UPI001639AA94|nr:vWA domain-containing protein [Croceivirga lutea]GGG54194.1 hypothetical protein GCM10011414_24930 [Croceivirga lutea]
MTTLKKIILSLTLIFSLTSTYGCNLKVKPEEKETLVAEAYLPENNTPNKHYVKIALLLDTSNSMDGLINQAKAQLWDIINEFTYARCGNETRPEIQIALYEYGNDNLSSREGYIRQVLGFSSDLDAISERLFSLTTNGGEEFCGTVINTSLNQLNWGKNADDLKLIFIAGNEPFNQGRLDYRDATAQAKEKDIVVNTIFCGNFEQGISTNWKDGAVRTGGDYMAIDHNQELVYVETPYDDAIIILNKKLNNTYVGYGSQGQSKITMQREQDRNAEILNDEVAVKRAVSKSSRMYKNSTWDLVDAVEENEAVLETMETSESLPEELKGKTKEELKKYIAEKKEEREKIKNEIKELNAKREAFIAKSQTENTGGLENAMLSAIKKQASRKNYTWKN